MVRFLPEFKAIVFVEAASNSVVTSDGRCLVDPLNVPYAIIIFTSTVDGSSLHTKDRALPKTLCKHGL